jgi:hypothetical protein
VRARRWSDGPRRSSWKTQTLSRAATPRACPKLEGERPLHRSVGRHQLRLQRPRRVATNSSACKTTRCLRAWIARGQGSAVAFAP